MVYKNSVGFKKNKSYSIKEIKDAFHYAKDLDIEPMVLVNNARVKLQKKLAAI